MLGAGIPKTPVMFSKFLRSTINKFLFFSGWCSNLIIGTSSLLTHTHETIDVRQKTVQVLFLFSKKVNELVFGRVGTKGGRHLQHQSTVCQETVSGFPGGAVVKNPPANAGDMGSSPGPGRSHIPRSN